MCHVSTAIFSLRCASCSFFTLLLHIYESEKECTHTQAHTHSCSRETSLALAHTVLLSPEMYLVRAEEREKKIERKKGWCNYVWIPKHLHQGFLIFLQTFASEIQLPQCSHKTLTFIWSWLYSPFIFSYLKQSWNLMCTQGCYGRSPCLWKVSKSITPV